MHPSARPELEIACPKCHAPAWQTCDHGQAAHVLRTAAFMASAIDDALVLIYGAARGVADPVDISSAQTRLGMALEAYRLAARECTRPRP
jgi:hypothetical protein